MPTISNIIDEKLYGITTGKLIDLELIENFNTSP